MEKVIGIGGVFFKAQQPEKLANWYREHLGLEIDANSGGSVFGPTGDTIWAPFPQTSGYFGGPKPFMINYRVADLAAMLKQLRDAGVEVDEKSEESEQGKFGWATDPDGNRFELWEPPARKPGA
jgi:catechol 2,3-dioxygenase-like lactoylglutathione lyase family enzyme